MEAFDAGKRAYFLRKAMVHKVEEIGLTAQVYEATEAELLAKWGVAAPGDVFWAAANRAVVSALRSRSWSNLSNIYWHQSMFLFEQGRPHVQLGREASRAELRAMAQDGFTDEAVIIAGSCPVCGVDEGRRVKIAQEIAKPHIPHVDCPLGWCSCCYTPAVIR